MKRLLYLSSLFFFCFSANAQQLTEKDKNIIKYEAEMFIKEYELLLNSIISPNLSPYEIKEIIENSCNESANKIFLNPEVIIEDDIDPNYGNGTSVKDVKVKRYLNDLDLFYSKSTTPSISFYEMKSSEVKQKEYIYLEVYFKSEFQGTHHTIEIPYRPSERVATIVAKKEKELWKMSIASIVYYVAIKYPFVNPKVEEEPIVLNEAPLEAEKPIEKTEPEIIENDYFENTAGTNVKPKGPLYVSSVLGIVSLGSGIYFKSKANSSYKNYQDATDPNVIKGYRSDTEKYDNLALFSGITFGASALWYILYRKAYRKSLNNSLTVQFHQPMSSDFGLRITKTF